MVWFSCSLAILRAVWTMISRQKRMPETKAKKRSDFIQKEAKGLVLSGVDRKTTA